MGSSGCPLAIVLVRTVPNAQSILRAGESIEIAVSATYSSVGTATVTANVTGDQPDAVSTNNSATLSTTVTAPPPPPPAAPPPPPAAAPPQRPQTGGGGGGGASSALLLGLLALLAAFRRTSV